jgi:hypothetical protein
MAYLDAEFANIRLLWSRVGDRVLVAVLVALAIGLASYLSLQYVNGPIIITP